MTKEPVSLATLLHIYPVSCFIGDATHWICKVILVFLHLIKLLVSLSISEYLGVIWLSKVALGMVLTAARTRRRTSGGRHLGKTYLRLLRTFPVYMREDGSRRNHRIWLHELLLRRRERPRGSVMTNIPYFHIHPNISCACLKLCLERRSYRIRCTDIFAMAYRLGKSAVGFAQGYPSHPPVEPWRYAKHCVM
jgi:hypothetical protein